MQELRLRPPVLTMALIAVNVWVYLAIIFDSSLYSVVNGREILNETVLSDYWVYSNPGDIWDGAAWSLLGSAFVHFDFFHLLFNMMWFWGLASRIEITLGRQTLFALVFFGAIISSGAQLATGGWPCIGASGVVYALFGLALVARSRLPILALYLTPSVTWMLIGWLFLCLLISYAGLWPIGNAAHLAGFLFGLAVGLLFVVRRARIPAAVGLGLLAALTVCSAVWMPWSPQWQQWRVAKALKAGLTGQARAYLESGADSSDPVALNNTAWVLATRAGSSCARWSAGGRVGAPRARRGQLSGAHVSRYAGGGLRRDGRVAKGGGL